MAQVDFLPRNIVYKPRWSSTIEASEVALVVLTAEWHPCSFSSLLRNCFVFYLISPFIAVDDEIILIEIIVVDLMS